VLDLEPFIPDLFSENPALLVGVGPSLDGFDRWDDYDNILCLNETVLLAPSRAVGMAWDAEPVIRVGEVMEKVDPGAWPYMLIVDDIHRKLKRVGKWMHQAPHSYFSRVQCKELGCRIGTGSVAMGVFKRYGISEVHLVGFEAYWWWLRASESGSKKVDPHEAPDTAFECSNAIQAILEASELKTRQRGGPGSSYTRIARAMHSAATSRNIVLKEA